MRRLPRAARRIVLLVTALVTLGGAFFAPLQNLKNQEKYRAFFAEEYELALRLAAELPADAKIANAIRDGSQWAAHISGRDFLQRSGWTMWLPGEEPPRRAVFELALEPWPAPTRALIANRGLTHLYVSDHFETRYVIPPAHVDWTRTRFDSDGRLRAVLRSEHATLYEIVGEESREPE